MFRAADVLLITKSDLLPVLDDFSPERAEMNLRNLASTVPVIKLSARKDLGLQFGFSPRWRFSWGKRKIELHLADLSRTPSGTFFREVHPPCLGNGWGAV